MSSNPPLKNGEYIVVFLSYLKEIKTYTFLYCLCCIVSQVRNL